MNEPGDLRHFALEHLPDLVSVLDPAGTILYMSDECLQVLGFEPEEVVGLSGYDLMHPDDVQFVARTIHEPLLRTGNVERASYRLRHKDGTHRWFETVSRRVAYGDSTYLVASRREISHQLTSLDRQPLGTAIISLEGRYVRTSPQLAAILGRSSRQLRDSPVADYAHEDDKGALEAAFAEARTGMRVAWLKERRFRDADGEVVWLLDSMWVETDSEGTPLHLNSQLQDVTEHKRVATELQQSALHDGLTGLANRALLEDRIESAQLECRRDGKSIAVLYVDLDRFGLINASRGHNAGDRILRSVADELTALVRVRSLGTGEVVVARLSGDDFLLLCGGLQRETQAVGLARRLCDALDHPFQLSDGQEVFLSASVGVATDTTGRRSPSVLIANAEVAMRKAKQKGRGRIEVFDDALRDHAVRRLELDTGLRRARDRGELVLWYQPIVSLDDHRATGTEALARWMHPEQGMISPADFIPIAEETGYIVEVGRWALTAACEQMRRWRQEAPDNDLTVSVNISPRHLTEGDLISAVKESLESTATSPDSLYLEVTESALMDGSEESRQCLSRLKDLGVRIAIDDFGTGHSSLNQLKRLPVDVVKIDQTFVNGLGRSRQDLALVQAVITMAHALDLSVVAEGVETDEQLKVLEGLECDAVQGFLLAHPGPAKGAAALLDAEAELPVI